ncbi:MAG: hypothetical protein HY939_00200 [Gammaproteobacteria bacterium]|nr:hypothetical protein [Gammaproteobacteria bacterium]
MNLLGAYQKLKKLEPTFLTGDASAVLGISTNYAAIILGRLANQNAIVHLARGRWAYTSSVDPLLLPNILTYPMMSYISLYSALYYHGIIDQIPSTIFAVSNGKTKIFQTPLGKISIHSINSHLFTGYESHGKNLLLMATPEKALFDTFYLIPAKSNLFKRVTELDIPANFNFSIFSTWLKNVKNKSRRTIIEKRLEEIKQTL